MHFVAVVEPPEPMRGLELPDGVVASLGGGPRPAVIVTINGHSWPTRVALLRGRALIGLSHAHRNAAGVAIGDTVEVDIELDESPRVVVVPPDLQSALDDAPGESAAFALLSPSRQRHAVHLIDGAKKPETRQRRIDALLRDLRATMTS